MIGAQDRLTATRSVLLSSLPAAVADTVFSRSHVVTCERGATLFLQGAPAHSVFVVLAGWIKLFRIAQNGAEAVVGVFTRGQSFGEAAAFRNDVYPVAAEAVTDTRLLQVRAATILDLMRSSPEVCNAMLAATFLHLHALVGQIEQLKARTGPQRLAEFLLDLCPVQEGACAVTLPYEKALIAGRLGMKPESLSRAFARLRSEGVRVNQSQAVIADVGRLRTYLEEDRALAWGQTS
jgi:CRP-like cAMP-binding protein